MTQLPQPPVVTVTPTAPITEPPRTAVPPPAFSNGGDLLAGPCSSASYTLVSDGDLVLYAAFVGCDAGRPQCCPWNVSTEAAPVNPGAGGEGNGTPKGNRRSSGVRGIITLSRGSAVLIWNSGYYKFTRPIAFQTPCFSSLSGSLHASPPPITAGLAANPRDSSVPTSAIVNLAWAMGYNVSGEPTTALSKGAVIGIGVGSGVGVIVVVTVLAFLVIRWRRARKAATGGGGGGGVGQGVSYHEGYHAPGQEMAHVGGFKMVEYGGSGSGGGGSGGQQQWEGGQQELGGRQQQWEGRTLKRKRRLWAAGMRRIVGHEERSSRATRAF
ncbi:hypothetical protein C8A05DRAFT_46233 [Staphylotrichum tortipilum]|uniref:Uncharacterized protein n=1 Tax=Staphylotrichum tortipilum TaxID=2831512 RepID=A0AAN6RR67_9PEZI|nr:hypothetical protein C8A05DRAFT_46233 [Staphylotrichum longicolle]